MNGSLCIRANTKFSTNEHIIRTEVKIWRNKRNRKRLYQLKTELMKPIQKLKLFFLAFVLATLVVGCKSGKKTFTVNDGSAEKNKKEEEAKLRKQKEDELKKREAEENAKREA